MPRKPGIPQLTLHKASGRAVVRLTGRDHYLGTFGSPEAKEAYDRLIAEWLAGGRRVAHDATSVAASPIPGVSVNEVLLAFWKHAERHYRHPDGSPTTEIGELRLSLKPLKDLYGLAPAAEFGPKKLAAVRQSMIERGLCRTLINRRIDRVKRVFKWATEQELVPGAAYHALQALRGLKRGRTDARESEQVKPADPAHVAATLLHLDAHLRAMVELQRRTGMRPGEVCGLTQEEVDRSADVWLYRPARHKTAHHGRDRVVPIGPRARAVLTAFLLRDGIPPDGFGHVHLNDPDEQTARLVMADAHQEAGRERDAALLRDTEKRVAIVAGCIVDPAAPLFSPAEAREERFRAMRAARKSKVPPSQRGRRKSNPERCPGSEFRPAAYAHAVQKAAKRAGVLHWHPNQLRHLFATEVRAAFGLEAAQVLLGHSRADVTQVYAERDLTLAVKVAGTIG